MYPAIKWRKIVTSTAGLHEQNAAVAMRDEIAPHGGRKHFPAVHRQLLVAAQYVNKE